MKAGQIKTSRLTNVVVIPVYKPKPAETEIRSLRQALTVLGTHDIRLIGPEGLDLSAYEAVYKPFGRPVEAETFDPSYFSSVAGYNKLMLSRCFYQRFASWDYLLIYQLDAWVFKDELDAWCAKGYDYIGAPWMKLNGRLDEKNSGNGGFSLRKIATFIELFDHEGPIWGYKGLVCRYRYRGPLRRRQCIFRGLLGWKNKLSDFAEKGEENEDLFFAALKHKKGKPFRIPPTCEAMYFSFEESPAMLYERTGHTLPFGCHAWEKWEYETFWKQFID